MLRWAFDWCVITSTLPMGWLVDHPSKCTALKNTNSMLVCNLEHTFNVLCLCLVPTNIPCFFFLIDLACLLQRVHAFTSSTESGAAWPGGVVPGKANKRIPVQRGVKSVMDPWVLLPHQHLSRNTTKHLKQWWKCWCFLNKDFLFLILFFFFLLFFLPWQSTSCLLAPELQEFPAHHRAACSGRWYPQHRTCAACQWSASR